uniref:hypothetical protein n=1 Tax=Proteus mirabilis TaxID=584 RepID=UPI001953D519
VENHRVARARREAGRQVWDHKFNIKEILFRDRSNETNEHAAAVGNQISALIKSSAPAAWFSVTSPEYDTDIDDIVDWLSDLK